MASETLWRDGETRVVTVTPVARGVVRPALAAVVAAAAVVWLARQWSWAHRQEGWLLLALVGPSLLVLATRTWRWRSHKVHVTSERIIVEGGVVHRIRSSVELADVLVVHVAQRVRDRVARRGEVYVDTAAGTFALGRVRQPAALCRLIERERAATSRDRLPLDTVFEYEDPSHRGFGPDPRWPRRDR